MTIKEMRNNPLYTTALQTSGNGKLLDYDDDENEIAYRYAQVNVRAVIDCPFRSKGCESVCYATKGNHVFRSVKESRSRSYNETKRNDFSEAMVYTIKTEKLTARYKNAVMIVRIHESGDFYSLQYLKKWVKVWKAFENDNSIVFVFYTKSFPFFLMLTEEEKETIRRLQKSGRLSINLSLDDTTNQSQRIAYLDMIATYPLCNTYYCTEDVNQVEHDNVCDCADCAKCGACNKSTGKKTVVKIHSASKTDMKKYREHVER